MNDYEKMLEKMRALSDDVLKEIVLVSFADYTDPALEAARAVLDERGITESVAEQRSSLEVTEEDLVTFNDCLKAVDYPMVEAKLLNLFKEPERSMDAYRKVYSDLMLMPPTQDEPVLLLLAQVKEDLRLGYPFDVLGIEAGQEGYFGLEMFKWSDWLGLKLYEGSKGLIFNLGLDEFVAICLRKMTTFGFTEAEIEQKINEIESFEDGFFEETEGTEE
jgi:hypothetical protein